MWAKKLWSRVCDQLSCFHKVWPCKHELFCMHKLLHCIHTLLTWEQKSLSCVNKLFCLHNIKTLWYCRHRLSHVNMLWLCFFSKYMLLRQCKLICMYVAGAKYSVVLKYCYNSTFLFCFPISSDKTKHGWELKSKKFWWLCQKSPKTAEQGQRNGNSLQVFVSQIVRKAKYYYSVLAAFWDDVLCVQVLQKLGKAKETTDDEFEHSLHRFNDQQVISLLLNKRTSSMESLYIVYFGQ